MFKTREDKEEFIENLDGAMKVLHYRFHVFDGGCVYVAALLADGLEQLNIPFDVVIYEHPHEGKNLTPEQLASQGDICHVAISVTIGRKSIELGGEIASQLMNEENVTKSIHHMSSQELMDIYIQNLHKLILTDFNQSDEQVINPMYKVRQKQNK